MGALAASSTGPRFGHSPDSGRPPAETAPGGRPDTTAPVESGDAGRGDLQCGTLDAGQVVINAGVHRGTPRPTGLPVIDSPEAAGKALGELFLANADRGDDAANDHLVAELVRRIRAQQNSRDGGRSQQPPSQPAGCTPAGMIAVAQRRDTIPITGRLDGHAHNVTGKNVVASHGTGGYEAALATPQIPTPQFGNSPDSGRPSVERPPRSVPAPGGRPDTTTPVDSASPAADVARGDRPSGGREQPRLGRRRGVVIDSGELPVTSVDPLTGPSPELAVALVLHQAHGCEVVKSDKDYLEHGLPAPGSLAGVFDELLDAGSLAPAARDDVSTTSGGG